MVFLYLFISIKTPYKIFEIKNKKPYTKNGKMNQIFSNNNKEFFMNTIPVTLKFFDEHEQPFFVKAKVHEPGEIEGQSLAVVEVDEPEKNLKLIQDALLITATPDYPVTVFKGDVEVEVTLALEFEELVINRSGFKQLKDA